MNREERELLYFEYFEGNLSKEEERNLLEMVAVNADYQKEMDLWSAVFLGENLEQEDSIDQEPLLAIPTKKSFFILYSKWAIAASILFALGVLTWISVNWMSDGLERVVVSANDTVITENPILDNPSKKMEDSNILELKPNTSERKDKKQATAKSSYNLVASKSSAKTQKQKAIGQVANPNEVNQPKDTSEAMPPEKVVQIATLDSAARKVVVKATEEMKVEVVYGKPNKKTLKQKALAIFRNNKTKLEESFSKPSLAFNKKEKNIKISNKRYTLTLK